MRRRPQEGSKQALPRQNLPALRPIKTGLVLSGGGARAAYQIGALRALQPFLEKSPNPFSIVVGSSVGAINGIVLSACLKDGLGEALSALEELWVERTYRNTFRGSPSQAFFRAIRMAVVQYMAPGPHPTKRALFDPSPMVDLVDKVIAAHGGLTPAARHPGLEAVGVMTTIEGPERKPLLFLSTAQTELSHVLEGASFEIARIPSLTAKHGFASAALPSVLPPVELDTEHATVRLVDGGISQNVPVDPAVRLGADRVILCDVSGRDFWLNQYGEAHDTRPTWEVPAGLKTFCMRPPETFVSRIHKPVGQLLRAAVGSSRKRFMAAIGPVWPVFRLLSRRLGEDLAYEAVSYVALDPDFIRGLIAQGFEETRAILRNRTELEFQRVDSFENLAESLLNPEDA